MRKLTSREIVLTVAVLGIGVLGWVYGKGANLGVGGTNQKELDKIDFGDAPEVQLALLGQGAVDFDPQARNLFNYYTPPAPVRKAPPPPPPRKIVTQQPTTTNVATRRPPAPPRAEPKPPKPTFRYIGLIGHKENRIAVLEQGDQVLLAAVGEVVDEQYTVVEFRYKALVLGYTAQKWVDKTTELTMTR